MSAQLAGHGLAMVTWRNSGSAPRERTWSISDSAAASAAASSRSRCALDTGSPPSSALVDAALARPKNAAMIDVALSHTLSPTQVDQLLTLYDDVWWAKGRTRAGVEAMLRGCLAFAFIDGEGRLQAFARVVGDGIYKATVFDVIVTPDQRGTGLGQYVMDAVMAHPAVASVRHVELQCKPELDEFYRPWGFTPVEGILYMRRTAT